MSSSNPLKGSSKEKPAEKNEGRTRKSAAQLKPATKAGASVDVKSGKSESAKVKSEKKRIRDEELRKKFRFYHIPTDTYKRYFLICVIAVVNAIVFFIAAMVCRELSPSETLPFVFLFIADMSLVFAFIVNWKRIKPEREEYQTMMAKEAKSKANRAAAKQKKAKENASKAK